MRAKSYVAVLASLLLAAVSVLAWQQYQELVSLRARIGGDGDLAALQSRLTDALRRNRQLEAQLAAARGATGAGGGAAAATDKDATAAGAASLAQAAAGNGTDAAMSKRDAELELLAALADVPEFQNLIALQQRGAIDSKYSALFRKLHLTPEQEQQFERLLADKQSAFADAMIAARDQGLNGKQARDMAMTVARATQKDIENSIKSLLGPQDYGQYQNYERTMPQRETVNQLAQRLAYTATPLTTQQQDRLVQTLAQAARQQNQAAVAAAAATGQKPVQLPATIAPLPNALNGLGLGSAGSAAIAPLAVTRAQSFLTQQQLTALQQMQQEQQAQQTLSQLIRNGARPAPLPAKSGKG